MAKLERASVIRAARLLMPIAAMAIVIIGPAFGFAQGSICTISIGPISLACPLGFAQVNLASQSIVLGLIVPAAIVVAGTILLGRVFCGWVCPAGSVIQSPEHIGYSRRMYGSSVSSFARQNSVKITLLGSLLVASALLRYPVFCVVCPVGIICRNAISLFGYGSLGLDLLLVPAIIALELVIAPWCPYICPLGTAYGILSRRSLIVPAIDKAKCTACSLCEKACRMKVPLLSRQNLGNCTKCLECGLKCPEKAVRHRWRIWS